MDGFPCSSWTTGRISPNPTRSSICSRRARGIGRARPLAQAQILQWMFFEQYSHEPNIATVRFWLSVRKPEPTPFNTELLAETGPRARGALSHGASSSGPLVFRRRALHHCRYRAYFHTHVAGEGGFDPHTVSSRERVARSRPARAEVCHDRRVESIARRASTWFHSPGAHLCNDPQRLIAKRTG